MKNYIYSAKNNAFFELVKRELYDSADWDLSDAIEVDDAVFNEFTALPPAGKTRASGADGMPCWVDVPPPTPEQLRADAEVKKMALKNVADSEIAWRQDAVDAGIATASEITALAAWKKYRVLLMRIDTANPAWPDIPAE